MPVTGVRGRQILDGDVFRNDLNTTTSGSAVITKIIAGTNITISSTGVDAGTGDVTINATASSSGATWVKEAVVVATTGNITLSGTQTIDGVAVSTNNRVLVKNQTTASQNGIYIVNAGAWTRATDSDTSLEVASSLVAVLQGTTNGGTTWDTDFKSTDTLGTTAMTWSRMIDTGYGQALTKTDDTNVTLTLGGTPATALIQATSLTLGWTGQLAVGRGGTGASTLTGVLIGNGTSAFTGVTGTASQLLRRNAGNTAYEFFSAGNLTRTDDTNVTLTLGGTPTGALINAVSLTLGWTGQLAVGRGGSGASTLTGVLIGNGTSAFTGVVGTASQLLRRNAGNTAYEFFTHDFASTGTGTANTLPKYSNANTLTNSSITDTGAIVTILGTTAFLTEASLGSAAGGNLIIVDNYASPNSARIFFGDRTGWSMHFSTRSASVTRDEVTLTDAGHVHINAGYLKVGTQTSVNGSTMLLDNYTNGNLTTFGTNTSSGNAVIGYGITPSVGTSDAFVSSTALAGLTRGALSVSQELKFFTGAAQTVAVGSAATLSLRFYVKSTGQLQMQGYTTTSSFTGTAVGVLAFDSSGNILTIPTPGGGSGLTGSGTTNYLPKFTGSTTLGDSTIFDNGSNVGIGTATPTNITNYRTLHVQGGASGAVLYFSSSDGTGRGYIYGSTAETAINCPNQFRVYVAGSTSILSTTSGVGIGAQSNGYNLFVQGTGATLLEVSSTSANGGYIGFTRSSTTYFGYIGNSAQLFGAGYNGNTSLGIRSEGDINFGTSGGVALGKLASTGQLKLALYTSLSSFTGTAVGYLGFDSSGNIITASPPTPSIVYHTNVCFSAEVPNTWSNMPNTLQFFDSSSAYVTEMDLSLYNEVRLIVNRQGTAGAAASKLILRYQATTGAPFTASSYLDIGTSEVSLNVSGTNDVLITNWIPMVSGAIGNVFLALLGSGGDSSADPVFGNIYAEFRNLNLPV